MTKSNQKRLLLVSLVLNFVLYADQKNMDTVMTRKAAYPIEDIFINRWSGRAMSGQTITDQDLYRLFEAARWAPSSYNSQPWRFVYAQRATKYWDVFFNFLVPFNQEWCKNAAALVVILSKKTFDWNEPSRTHSFDTGAAWQNLALQGSSMGLVIHGMSGFDYEKAKKELNVSDDFSVEAMFAVGYPGKLEVLPENMRKDEEPSGRTSVKDMVFEGVFKQ